jgi:hypothetical protein
MNRVNEQVDLLLDAAAHAPRHLREEPSLAVEHKVISDWRGLHCRTVDTAQVFLPLLRRAVICACLLMLLSIGLSYRSFTNADMDDVIMANSAVDLTLLP